MFSLQAVVINGGSALIYPERNGPDRTGPPEPAPPRPDRSPRTETWGLQTSRTPPDAEGHKTQNITLHNYTYKLQTMSDETADWAQAGKPRGHASCMTSSLKRLICTTIYGFPVPCKRGRTPADQSSSNQSTAQIRLDLIDTHTHTRTHTHLTFSVFLNPGKTGSMLHIVI